MPSHDFQEIRIDLVSERIRSAHKELIEDISGSKKLSLTAHNDNIFEKLEYYLDEPLKKTFKMAGNADLAKWAVPSDFGFKPFGEKNTSTWHNQPDYQSVLNNLNAWDSQLKDFYTFAKSTSSENTINYLIYLIARIKRIRPVRELVDGKQRRRPKGSSTGFCGLCHRVTERYEADYEAKLFINSRPSEDYCYLHQTRDDRKLYDRDKKYKKTADQLVDSLHSPSKHDFIPSMRWFLYQSNGLGEQGQRRLAFALAQKRLMSKERQEALALLYKVLAQNNDKPYISVEITMKSSTYTSIEGELFQVLEESKDWDLPYDFDKIHFNKALSSPSSLKEAIAQDIVLNRNTVIQLNRNHAVSKIEKSLYP